MSLDAGEHYDRITGAWMEFMGNNFHFGYFEEGGEDIAKASERLVDRMLELVELDENSRVLDVGCGIGTPAFHIHRRFGCYVEGISTSRRGVEEANRRSRELGYSEKVRFRVADGQDNQSPDNSFDVVWIMEAAHLMFDKARLFSECHRVLREGGVMVMCDIVTARLIPPHRGLWHFLRHLPAYYRLLKAWGPAQLPTLGNYVDRLVEAGFTRVLALDITPYAAPTLSRWRENALPHVRSGVAGMSPREVKNFVRACEILDNFFRGGIFGYGMIRAEKGEAFPRD
jgi:cyclopropane fatty-acyl-phospholipid synthase-like methyltransferase